MVAGINFDHQRLFYEVDPAYRLLLIASLKRAGELQAQMDRERTESTRT